MPENALDHAQAAGDADTAARLVVQLCNPVWATGRNDTVRRWMEWFEANDLIERHPGVAVCGALQFAVDGLPTATERWADAAEAISMAGVLADGSTIEGMVAYMRANLCRNGPEAMRRDAQVAWHGLSPTSPFRCNMIQVEGLSHLLEGDTDRADAFLARAVDEATRRDMRPFLALLLTDRGSVALERDDRAAAGTFADQALTIMHGGQFDDYWTSALVYAWTARVAAYAVTRSRDDSSSHEPLGSGRCSPTRCPWSPLGRCWRWPGRTSRSPTRAARGRSSGRPTTSSSNGPPLATCRSRPTSFGPRSKRSELKAWGHRR